MLQPGFTRVRQRRRQTNTASTSTQSMNQTTTSQNSSGIQLQITEWQRSTPSQEEVELTLEGYAELAQMPVVMH